MEGAEAPDGDGRGMVMKLVEIFADRAARTAAVITPLEWDKIEMKRDLEATYYIIRNGDGSETLMCEQFTCLGSWYWGGTCRCIHHEPRTWREIRDWYYIEDGAA